MGADGHIDIWRDDIVRKAFPDCDELFALCYNHYTDKLDNILYHHCYYGDNMVFGWDDNAQYKSCDQISDWKFPERLKGKPKDKQEFFNRFLEFVRFLNSSESGIVHWEVWT